MIALYLYRNPRMLLLAVVVIAVAGAASFVVLPRIEDPVLRQRVGIVSTVFPGSDALRIERSVSKIVEESLSGIAEIGEVRSKSRAGQSTLVIELEDEVTDVSAVWRTVRDRLARSRDDLPEGCFTPELEVFPLKAYASLIAITGGGESKATVADLHSIAEELSTRLAALPGVESIDRFGDPEREILVEVDPSALLSLSTTTTMIAERIAGAGAAAPGGNLSGDAVSLPVLLGSEASPIDRLSETLLPDASRSSTVRLGDVATIRKTSGDPPSTVALIDGKPSIVLGVYVDDATRVDDWSAACRRVIEAQRDEGLNGAEIEELFIQSEFVSRRMHQLLYNLAVGVGAVAVVVWLLMGWRSMLVVSTTLPLAALITLAGMRVLHLPIHQMSVTGLIVSLGLLIDNAIVVVDDIRRRVEGGGGVEEAIQQAVLHLRAPLLASTITTCLAFLPIALLPGPAGEFVGTIAVSVILAVGASLCLALTVVPALLAVLRIDRGVSSLPLASRTIASAYEASLGLTYRFPLIGIFCGAALPIVGWIVASELPEQFFPSSDRDQLHVELELPARATSESTLALTESVNQTVAAHSGVERAHWFVGASAPTFYYNVVPRRRKAPNYAQAIIDAKPGIDLDELTRSLQAEIDDRYPSCLAIVQRVGQGPPIEAPIELRLYGPDLDVLRRLGDQLRLGLSQTNHVLHTRSDISECLPSIGLEVYRTRAARVGLSEHDLAGLTYASLEGADAGSIFDDGEEVPVRVRAPLAADVCIDGLAALPLPVRRPSAPGNSMAEGQGAPPMTSLATIADLQLREDPAALTRINGRRVNEIKAYVSAGVLPSVVLGEFRERLADSEFVLPKGYELRFEGERAARAKAVTNLVSKAVILAALLVVTLVAAFQSFRAAMIIVVVGAATVWLAPLALWAFGYPFGFMAILGAMGLVGIAINDSIVVLAAIREHQSDHGGDCPDLVGVVSGSTRHVVATTLTTVAGFLPLILSGGGFWPPLAITIAGGVTAATFLALYFTPSLHLLTGGGRSHAGGS